MQPRTDGGSRFEVSVTKDYLVFSAAHFITYDGDVCEPLHGHNYRVEVFAEGNLDENQYVLDFVALKDATRKLTQALDHRVLLPTESLLIRVERVGEQVVARFKERHWSFPADECVLLPVANTTAERLAEWLAGRLEAALAERNMPVPKALRVRVEENFGQWATCIREPLGPTGPGRAG